MLPCFRVFFCFFLVFLVEKPLETKMPNYWWGCLALQQMDHKGRPQATRGIWLAPESELNQSTPGKIKFQGIPNVLILQGANIVESSDSSSRISEWIVLKQQQVMFCTLWRNWWISSTDKDSEVNSHSWCHGATTLSKYGLLRWSSESCDATKNRLNCCSAASISKWTVAVVRRGREFMAKMAS